METKPILLAEDDPKDIELTLLALAEHNLANKVVVARDGVEALDYLCRRGQFAGRPAGHPVVVLLDLKMPKVDGLEMLRQVKADPALKTIPIVVVTSSRKEQDVVESYNLGVNAYVVKPVAFDSFVEMVKQLGLFWVLTNEAPPGTIGLQILDLGFTISHPCYLSVRNAERSRNTGHCPKVGLPGGQKPKCRIKTSESDVKVRSIFPTGSPAKQKLDRYS